MKIVNSCIRCLRSGNWQGHSVASPHNKSCLLLHNQMPKSKIKGIKLFYSIQFMFAHKTYSLRYLLCPPLCSCLRKSAIS